MLALCLALIAFASPTDGVIVDGAHRDTSVRLLAEVNDVPASREQLLLERDALMRRLNQQNKTAPLVLLGVGGSLTTIGAGLIGGGIYLVLAGAAVGTAGGIGALVTFGLLVVGALVLLPGLGLLIAGAVMLGKYNDERGELQDQLQRVNDQLGREPKPLSLALVRF